MLKEELVKKLNLDDINWIKCETDARKSKIYEICEIKRKNPRLTSKEISDISGIERSVIVDYLKLAGAEAISINGERIISMTDIVDVGSNSLIFVNQQRILAPYVIKAIGNSSYLETALTGNGGHVDEIKKIGQNISIEKMNKVKILKYDGEIKTKYIQ